MSSSDLDDFWVHTVTVEPYLGSSGRGEPLLGPAQTVPCLLARKSRFIRNAQGEQVLSQASLSADAAWADALAPKSQITLDDDTVTTVLTRAISTGGGLIDGVDRVRVWLQ